MPAVTPRHDTERHAGRRQRQRLLAAPPEHERVAALEAQHAGARLRLGHQPGGNVRLAGRGPAAALARMVDARARPRHRQHARIDQRIVHDDIGVFERAGRQQGQQAGVAGARAHEPDLTRRQPRQVRRHFPKRRNSNREDRRHPGNGAAHELAPPPRRLRGGGGSAGRARPPTSPADASRAASAPAAIVAASRPSRSSAASCTQASAR